MTYDLVPCIWCGTLTEYIGTKMCSTHWQLFKRMEREPAMARRMLGEIEAQAEAAKRTGPATVPCYPEELADV